MQACLLYTSDTDIEPEVIQAANTYNEEYYQNLREYKKTDHAICFGWYAGYTSEASPSQGLHFTGLPDSLDIVSPVSYTHLMEEKHGAILGMALLCRISKKEEREVQSQVSMRELYNQGTEV